MALVNFNDWLAYQMANPTQKPKNETPRYELSDEEYRKKYIDVYGGENDEGRYCEDLGSNEERRDSGRKRRT